MASLPPRKIVCVTGFEHRLAAIGGDVRARLINNDDTPIGVLIFRNVKPFDACVR